MLAAPPAGPADVGQKRALLIRARPDRPHLHTAEGRSSRCQTRDPSAPDQRAIDIARVSTVTATAIAVADMIGIGVFTSLGFQVRGIPSAFSLVMLWVVGGITALCGALSYAELAAALPRSGGEYNFLSRIYHPAVGFLAGWISATVGFAAPIAVAAMAFGIYFDGVFPGSPPLLLGLALVWIVSLVHLSGIRHSSTFQNVSTAIKVVLIAAFIVAGFAFGTPQPISFAPSRAGPHLHLQRAVRDQPRLRHVLLLGLERRHLHHQRGARSRAQPAALAVRRHPVVMVLYVALNAVFLYTTPMEKMAGQINVAQIVGAANLRRSRRPGGGRADLHRPHLGGQRHGLDRTARDHGDRRGHARAALLRAHHPIRRAGDRHPLSARRRHTAAASRKASRRSSTTSSSA